MVRVLTVDDHAPFLQVAHELMLATPGFEPAGEVSSAEAANHPLRNVVTRALGMSPGPEPDLWVFPPTAGERFLICSDGLPLELTDAEIAGVLRTGRMVQDAADELVRLAVEAGGRDNVTVVVVDYTPDIDGEVDGDTTPRSAP